MRLRISGCQVALLLTWIYYSNSCFQFDVKYDRLQSFSLNQQTTTATVFYIHAIRRKSINKQP